MSSTARRLNHASAPRTPAFELTASRQFTAWLAEQKASLAFTTYQAGKLFLLGLQPDGQLSIFNRTFERCMGLWTSPDRLLMSSLYQLWRFENALAPRQTHQGYDRIYVPQLGWTTGDLDVHDIAVDRVDDALEAVSPLDGGTFDPTSRVITWNLGDLPPGTPRDVSQPKHKPGNPAHVLLTAPHIGRAVCSGSPHTNLEDSMQRNLARRTFTGLNAVLLAGLAMALPAAAVTTCTYRTPLGSNICFPNAGSGWNTATPESKGMTTAGLNAFASYIGSYGVVIKNGYKIYSWGSPPSQYNAGSGTKSLFGMVFARLKQDGIFTDSTTLASQGWAMRGGADADTAMTINQVLNLNGSYAIRGSEAPGLRRAINDYDVNLLFKTLWNKTRALYNQNLNTYAMSKFGTAIGVADVFTSSGKGYGSPEPNSTYRIGTGNTTCAGLPSNGHGCGIHTLMSADEFGRVGWFFANSGFWGGSGQLIAASRFPTACLNDGDPPSTVVGAASPNGDNGNGGTGPYPDTTRDYLRVGSFGGPANSQRPQPNGVHSGWTNGMVFNRTAFRGSCGGQKSVNWRDAPHLDTFMIPGGSSSDYRVIIVSRAHKLVVAFRTTIPEFRTHLVGSLTSPANTAMKKLRQALSSVPAQLPACY